MEHRAPKLTLVLERPRRARLAISRLVVRSDDEILAPLAPGALAVAVLVGAAEKGINADAVPLVLEPGGAVAVAVAGARLAVRRLRGEVDGMGWGVEKFEEGGVGVT